ncbi:MAG: hypothetical protein JMN26_18015, partial [gamma proteobacterium endosymbiont of Lamellibrachia anaximandri]|nr:hypothetical protein [gamma proteobacterium endosymbiont of Lamellibrachia anaximandri]
MTYKACCMLFLSAILAGCSSPEDPSVYSYSSASYEELNAEVGCGSKYSDDKKDDIFNSYYKNHYMTWRGEVILAEADKASLNIDSKGIQDLAVDFAIKNAGYHLIKGQFITVIFVMKHAGGCFLPFMGDHAIIQLEQKELVLSDTAGHDTATRFLEQQLREYESRLIDAENRLTDFKRKNIDADKLDIPPKVEDELKRLTQDYNNNKETYEQLVQRLESARMSEHVQPALGDTRVESDTAQRFLEQQIREYESRLIEAENRLTDFKRKYIDTLPGQGGGVFARLQEVRVTLQDLNLELKEARIRRDELRRQYEAAERD